MARSKCSRAGISFPKRNRIPLRQMSFQQKTRVLHALCQAHELLCQLKCRLQLSPYEMKGSQPKQHWKETSILARLPAQLYRSLVDRSSLRRSVALRCYQSRTKHRL